MNDPDMLTMAIDMLTEHIPNVQKAEVNFMNWPESGETKWVVKGMAGALRKLETSLPMQKDSLLVCGINDAAFENVWWQKKRKWYDRGSTVQERWAS